jgi:probable HAF family extracellular repeat protein
MKLIRSLLLVLEGFLIVAGNARAADHWTFQTLSDLVGHPIEGTINDISADGSTIVGTYRNGGYDQAFRWTAASGFAPLDTQNRQSIASAASADGSTIVGWTVDDTDNTEAFRWTGATGLTGLGDLYGGALASYAYGVSADGSYIAGAAKKSAVLESAIRRVGYSWQSVGLEGVGSSARDVFQNGQVIVGTGRSQLGQQAYVDGDYVYYSGVREIGLGDLDGGIFESAAAKGVSGGSVIVGYGNSALGQEAIRWSRANGMVGLGDLPGGAFSSRALAATADASQIIGAGSTALGPTAFTWDSQHGMRDLNAVLDIGNLSGISGLRLTEASAISADGSAIVGSAVDSQGVGQSWIARRTSTAAPIVTWGEPTRTTHAHSYYKLTEGCDYDDEGNLDCRERDDSDSQSSHDYGMLTGSVQYGGVRVTQFAAVSGNTLEVYGATSASSNYGGTGEWSYISTEDDSSDYSQSFTLSKPALLNLRGEVLSYISGEVGSHNAFVRIIGSGIDLQWNTSCAQECGWPDQLDLLNIDEERIVPPGEYQITAHGFASALAWWDSGGANFNFTLGVEPVAVPEPSTLLLAIVAAVTLCAAYRLLATMKNGAVADVFDDFGNR